MTKALLLCAAILAVGATPVVGSMLDSGVDTGKPESTNHPQLAATGCSVLWFMPGVNDEPSRVARLGFDVTATTNPADLNAANLARYDILVIAYTGRGLIGAAQSDIQGFVQCGHGLLIHQMNVVGVADYAPVGLGVNTTDPYWCNYFAYPPELPLPTIVDHGHPLTFGLTDADLSGADDKVTLDPGYQVLARSIACGDPALAAATFGSGRVVYEDGNVSRGSDVYWSRIFSWLCGVAATPTKSESWGSLKSRYR